MCEIDWAALGTWAAVVFALWVTVAEARRRHKEEWQEASILAVLVKAEITRLGMATSDLRKRLNEAESPTKIDILIHGADTSLRTSLGEFVDRLQTPVLDRSVDRMRVLPAHILTPIMSSLIEFTNLRLHCEAYSKSTSEETPTLIANAVQVLQDEARSAIEAAKLASGACDIQSNTTAPTMVGFMAGLFRK